MTISSKRFKFLDNETNVAVSDFLNVNASNILNSPNNELKNISKEFGSFLSNSTSGTLSSISKNETISSITNSNVSNTSIRTTKDCYSTVNNVCSTNTNTISAYSNTLTNNNSINGLINQLSPTSKNTLLGISSNSKSYATINTQGGTYTSINNKDSNLLSNIVSEVVKNKTSITSKNNALLLMTGLATASYAVGALGSFTDLQTISEDTSVVNKATSNVAGNLVSNYNSSGLIDLANSTTTVNSSLCYPNLAGDALNNYTKPDGITDYNLSTFNTSYLDSMNKLDPNWNKSDYDNGISISNTNTDNINLSNLYESKASDRSLNTETLNVAPDDEALFMAASYRSYNQAQV